MNDQDNIYDYITQREFAGIQKFVKGKKTPFLILSLKRVEKNYDELAKNLPYAKIYYAIKANPEDEVLKLLHRKGSNFDVATTFEMDQLLRLGVDPSRMSYGNTIKKEEDIAYAYKKGIRQFVISKENPRLK